MKKLFWNTVLLALAIAAPQAVHARVDVSINIALPPPIIFGAPPQLIVLPETYVYVVPDADVDIFFFDGWWWRPWEGHWYRSSYYDSGWTYYERVPVFYREVPSGWRNDYRDHRWRGHPWEYQRIPHQQVQQNWRSWKKDRHWEKEHTWGVKGLQARTPSPNRSREEQRHSRSQERDMRPERSPQHREAGPRSRDAVKEQRREVGPRSREGEQQQRERAGSQPRKTKPKHQEAAPRSPEGQPQGGHEGGEGQGRR
jgi:hypothetical protein